MWRFLHKKKDDLTKLFANDFLAAAGKLPMHAEFIRYRITPGVTADFDLWLQNAFSEFQLSHSRTHLQILPTVYFIHSAVTDLQLPMIGLITPSNDAGGREYPFGMLRILEHPLAQEFRSIIPWLYRESFSHMHQFPKQKWKGTTLSTLFKQIEHLRFCNCSIKRRDALEAIVQQLRYMTFDHLWQAMRLPQQPVEFISQTSVLIQKLKTREYQGIRLPLPNQHDLLPTIIFWMQLLESALGDSIHHWQLYWHGHSNSQHAAMVFFHGTMPADYMINIVDQQLVHPMIADTLTPLSGLPTGNKNRRALVSDPQMSMIKLLSWWGQVLIEH